MDQRLTDSQINRFLNGECSEEEYLEIITLAERSEAYQYLLQQWVDTGTDEYLPEGLRKNMLEVIKQGTHTTSYKRVWIAAASIIVLVFAGSLFFARHRFNQSVEQEQVAIINPTIEQQNRLNFWRNDSVAISEHRLPDGSQVKLYKGASVQFQEGFGTDPGSRQLHLEGKAYFNVQKDLTRPFTVFTGLVSTTALGTSFTIEKTEEEWSIRMHTGKVKLKKEQPSLPGWEDGRLLVAGEVLQYNSQSGLCRLDKEPEKTVRLEKPVTTNKQVDFQLVFNNSTLKNVLDSLSKSYNVRISYSDSLINGRHFTGQVKSTDSLPVLLKLILQLNDLDMDFDKGKGYRIIPK